MKRGYWVFTAGYFVGILTLGLIEIVPKWVERNRGSLSYVEIAYMIGHHVSEERILRREVESKCIGFAVDTAAVATLTEAGASSLFVEALRIAKPCGQ